MVRDFIIAATSSKRYCEWMSESIAGRLANIILCREILNSTSSSRERGKKKNGKAKPRTRLPTYANSDHSNHEFVLPSPTKIYSTISFPISISFRNVFITTHITEASSSVHSFPSNSCGDRSPPILPWTWPYRIQEWDDHTVTTSESPLDGVELTWTNGGVTTKQHSAHTLL